MKLLIISFLLSYSEEMPDYKAKNRQLMEECSFLTEPLVRELRKCSAFPCRRLNFICKAKQNSEALSVCYGVGEMEVPFRSDYFTLSETERAAYLYELLCASMQKFCSIVQHTKPSSPIDSEFFKPVLDSIRANNFVSRFDTGLKIRGSGGLSVKVTGEQTIGKADFYAEFYKNGELISRKHLFSSKPNVFDYDRFLGKLTWSDGAIRLYSKDGSSYVETFI